MVGTVKRNAAQRRLIEAKGERPWIKNSKPLLGPGSGRVEERLEPKPVSAKGKEQIPAINEFVNELIKFCYQNCPIKMLAVPHDEYLPGHYYCLSRQATKKSCSTESSLQGKPYEPIPSEEYWGKYTLNREMLNFSLSEFSEYRVAVSEVKVKKAEKKDVVSLLSVVDKLVIKYNATHFVTDIRYLMYLQERPQEIPEVMKNGKGNIFAGTTVMIGSVPHVVKVTWRKGRFEPEFVSLADGFPEGVQFLLILK